MMVELSVPRLVGAENAGEDGAEFKLPPRDQIMVRMRIGRTLIGKAHVLANLARRIMFRYIDSMYINSISYDKNMIGYDNTICNNDDKDSNNEHKNTAPEYSAIKYDDVNKDDATNRYGTGHARPIVTIPILKTYNFSTIPQDAIASIIFYCRTDHINAVVQDFVAADLLWQGSAPLAIYADYQGVEKLPESSEAKNPYEAVLAIGGLIDEQTGVHKKDKNNHDSNNHDGNNHDGNKHEGNNHNGNNEDDGNNLDNNNDDGKDFF